MSPTGDHYGIHSLECFRHTYQLRHHVMLVAGHCIVESVVSRLWKRYLPSTERHTPLPAIVGAFDRFLFATSWLLGVKEFIAVWLAIKLAGQWSPTKTDVDRPLYYIFIIGHAHSLISCGTAIVIQNLVC